MDNFNGKVTEVCEHCGQELQKASTERRIIQQTQLDNMDKVSDALQLRQNKLDDASADMLAIIQRIEAKVGADEQTRTDIEELRLRVRAKAEAEEKEAQIEN
jgi:hypothetical protein